MEKAGGRPRDEVWQHVKRLEGGRRVKCNHCGFEFEAIGSSRIKAHINGDKGKGIRACSNFPQSHNFGSDSQGNSNHLKDSFLHPQGFSFDGPIDHRKSNEAGKIQGDARYEEKIQVGSSSVSSRDNEYLQVLQYVFENLSPGDKVYDSGRLNLSQKELITFKPRAFLVSSVIDVFAEILTESEKKKATPSNCYLPVMFSTAALVCDEHNFKDFVHRQKMRENYIFDQESPEKVFIPVHNGPEAHGHFYLYIFYKNKNVIEIWDSLSNKFVAATERDETTKKLLFAMEILFEKEKGAFSNYKPEMANDILSQDNGFDCGVFVIKYMQQSDNYVKSSPLFQFDSQKERNDLALKLLNNDLNQEKQNLYVKARRHYAQVEKQDGNKRLRVDPSKEHFEDVGRDMEAEYDYSNEHDDDDSDEEYDDEDDDDSDEDDDGLENVLIGKEFQSYTEQIREWIEDDEASAIGVWGMGGSGKTALVSHIYNKLLEGGDIKVIWVTVSQNSIYKLQEVIARSIKLDTSDEFEVKRIARKLFQAFKEMKKCVVILDDVWDYFFLKEVGFPMSDNRIKLILTTRIWEVCQGMGCEKYTIKVEDLCPFDSWTLFKRIVGFQENLSLEVEGIAWDVAFECEGFPLAIVRIATSMKGKKQVGEWSHMLECLKNLGHGQYEMDKWVFPILRSSYDFLNNKLQKFFLYWAISTHGIFDDEEVEDNQNHDDLIRRFVYESIDETKRLRVQYDEGYNMLVRLQNHSMLEFGVNKFFGALAVGIAEDTCKIMANAFKNLTEIPSEAQWIKGLQKAFLMGNKIKTIPDGTCLMCSQLSTLLLNDNVNLSYISDDFFKNMPALKTLDLSRTLIKSLPESVSNLKCLTVLLLSDCKELSYIPSLSKLRRLISLDVLNTAITKAPMGLESLVNLRYLNLLGTNMLMSSSLISKLIKVEHLLGPEVREIDIQGLDNLEVIVAFFDDISVFNTYVEFLDKNCKLRGFHLIFGDANERDDDELKTYREYYSTSIKRITFWGMDLGNREAVILPGDMKELFINNCQRVGTVGNCLCSVVLTYGHNNNIPHQIEWLDITGGCEDMKYLCCISGSCPFCSSSQLVGRLCLFDLEDLKYIVPPHALPSSHQPGLFSHLTDLEIEFCDSMEALMTPKLLALLQNLRSIEVHECEMMKEIVEEDHSQTANVDLMALIYDPLSDPTPITLPKLTSMKLKDMPQLNFVYRGIMICPSLQTFDAQFCYQLNRPRIEISNGCQLPMEFTSTGYHWKIETG